MRSIDEEIAEIENEIRNTQYNKATEFHIGRLKAKLAKLRRERELKNAGKKRKHGQGIKKTGDARVILLGYPSVGKSTILNTLTNAKSEVQAYDFSTLSAVPGILKYNDAQIQVLDTPGIDINHISHLNKEALTLARNADLILMVVDNTQYQLQPLLKVMYSAGIRLNTKRPKIILTKRSKDGIKISSTLPLTKLKKKTIESILKVYGIYNAHILFRENADSDQLIDLLTENVVYVPALVVLNKIDIATKTDLKNIATSIPSQFSVIKISARTGDGLEFLKTQIFQTLNLIKVYLKPPDKKVDTIILRKGATVKTLCIKIHKDFLKKFRYALITGTSAKHPQQQVGLDHKLNDGDIVSIVLRI